MGRYASRESYFISPRSPVDHGRDGLHSDPALDDSWDEEVFTFSGCSTPATDTSRVTGSPTSNIRTKDRQHRSGKDQSGVKMSKDEAQNIRTSCDDIVVERSKPIPIQYPEPKSSRPIEPLSARGDRVGAYFPGRECDNEIQQIYQSHPWGEVVRRVRQRSISQAEADAGVVAGRANTCNVVSSTTTAPVTQAVQRARTAPAAHAAAVTSPVRSQVTKRVRQNSIRQADADAGVVAGRAKTCNIVSSSTTAPVKQAAQRARTAPSAHVAGVTSPVCGAGTARRARTVPKIEAYNPTGLPGSSAALGKYYPTNYEAQEPGDPTIQSPRRGSSLSVQLSEAEQARQLLQYRRDIVTQTLQKVSEVRTPKLEGTASAEGGEAPALDEGSRKTIALGFALVRRYKPVSPKIAPLRSPGPVTPMALDETGASDYLGAKEREPVD